MILGIAGKMGAGKDTAADTLVNNYGFLKVSMADALRKECAQALAYHECPKCAPEDIRRIINKGPRVNVYAKPTSPDARRLLQWWGTDFRRKDDPDYWVKRVEPILNHTLDVVIPDIRFENEAAMVKRHCGQVWLVTRPQTDTVGAGHVSESLCNQYTAWHAIIDNNTDQKELENKVVRQLLSCYAGVIDDSTEDLPRA